MTEPEGVEQTGADRGTSGRDPYDTAPVHDPIFPSWRYAGLRWLADRLYGTDRPKG
jgi:hypothetical protein